MNNFFKKNCFLLTLISLFIVTSVCLILKINPKHNSTQWPKDGIYFLKSNAYLGYYSDEDPYIQLPFVFIHSKNPNTALPQYKTYTLKSNIGDISITGVAVTESSKEAESTLYTCGLNLQRLNPGIYEINNLQIENDVGKKLMADIGEWIIEVKNGKKETDLKIGKKMIFLGSFDWYRVELENLTDEPIEIKGLSFNLPDYSNKTIVSVATDFDMKKDQSHDTLLDSHKIKTYNYNFINLTKTKYDFVSLKPFLLYKKNRKDCIFSLPNVIYSSSFSNDQELINLLHNIKQLQ